MDKDSVHKNAGPIFSGPPHSIDLAAMAERLALYYKTLVKNGIPDELARNMTEEMHRYVLTGSITKIPVPYPVIDESDERKH